VKPREASADTLSGTAAFREAHKAGSASQAVMMLDSIRGGSFYLGAIPISATAHLNQKLILHGLKTS
jgi:hypothetical protein